jgi:zinc resistance-associated protein
MMWKTVLAGTTVLAIAGASFALADQGPGRPDHARHWQHHRQMSAADITAFSDARIAALHAGLELTADQEKSWPTVESALHALAKQRIDRMEARKTAQPATDPVARLNRRAEALQERGAALKKLADAAGPLYQSLDQAQKHRFDVLARLDRMRIGHGRMRHEWRGHHGWRHDGMRGPGQGAQPL